MATVRSMGLVAGHDPRYGINYKNIAKKITRLNWRKKAIIRDGNYIHIVICSYAKAEKEIKRYYIQGCPDKKGFQREHIYLIDGIKAANSYSKNEGDWPKEFTPGWEIFTKNRGLMRKIGEFKETDNGK